MKHAAVRVKINGRRRCASRNDQDALSAFYNFAKGVPQGTYRVFVENAKHKSWAGSIRSEEGCSPMDVRH
jgi:hypothetical protein